MKKVVIASLIILLLVMALSYPGLGTANFFPQDFTVIIQSPTNGTTLSTTTAILNVKTTVETDFYHSDKTLSYSLDGSPEVAFTDYSQDGGAVVAVGIASAEIVDLTSGPHIIVVRAQNRYSSTNDNPFGFTLLAQSACFFEVNASNARTPTLPPLIGIPAPMPMMLIVLLVAASILAAAFVSLVFFKRRKFKTAYGKVVLDGFSLVLSGLDREERGRERGYLSPVSSQTRLTDGTP